MWVNNSKSDMIVNLDRSAVIAVASKDLDKNEWAIIVHIPPLPPIVLFEGTRETCQLELKNYQDILVNKTQ
jgi:hypothetical protein